MKRFLSMILIVMIVMSMAITAHAATPSFKVPEVPQISKIKFNIKIELEDDFWDKWFEEHPFKFDFSKTDLPKLDSVIGKY